MGFFSGLTLGGMTGAVGRMASGGGGPFGLGAPAPRQGDGDLLDRLRTAMDPERLAIAQAMIAGDYGAVSRMTEPLRRQRLAKRAQASEGGLSKRAPGAAFDHSALGDDKRLSGSPDDQANAGLVSELSPTAFQSHTLPWPDSPVFRGRSGPSKQGEEVGEGIVGLARDLVAQETEAVRADRERYRAALAEKGLNGWGYTSRGEQDVHDLARIMYAEAFDVPEDMPAVGWVALNRTGRPGYGTTIAEVIHQPGQFEPVREGNRREVDSRHWTRFDQPHLVTEDERRRRKQAFGFAEAVLSGRQHDLTGGATHMQAPYADSPWFARAVRDGRLEPLPYRSKGAHPHRHLFYREAAPPKGR
jgi:spore germination cell wall hydrolase CwlJ-like protein